MSSGAPDESAAQRRDGESFRDWFARRIRAIAIDESRTIDGSMAPVFKEAGVLLPFWPENDGIRLALTLRTSTMSSHRGQVSLPGGRRDPEDDSIATTALRETHEELGIPPDAVELVTSLDDVWSIAGYVVTPHVGWLEQEPKLVPSVAEVARVIIADVERLMNPAIHRRHRLRHGGHRFTVHYFDYEGDVIWGLTGGILHSFFRLLRGQSADEDGDNASSLRRFLAQQES